jgi:hypothetical protein
MKKIYIAAMLMIGVVAGIVGCTANQRAKAYGGTETINIAVDQKVSTVTWKGEADLWILTRPMRPGEQAETLTFQEHSTYGMVEGTVILKESKSQE